MFVCEQNISGRLIIFDSRFQVSNVITGAFQYGVGATLDADGYLYVCDCNNCRIMKY